MSHYSILRSLGRGSSCEVSVARSLASGSLVALKRLYTPAFSTLPTSFAKLLNLSHPGLARLLEIDQEHRSFYTQELVEGISLRDAYLYSKTPNFLRLAWQLARTLEYLHKQNVWVG